MPRRARIARGSDLRACWETGRRFGTTHLEIAWRANAAGRPRTGIVVPRFGATAVQRNRLRRRLRELVRRESLPQLPPIDFVVRAKRAAYAASFADLRAELARAASRVS